MSNRNRRKFIFIDEMGDPGRPGNSLDFSYSIIMLDEKDIEFIEKELVYFRFYQEKFKELKEYTKGNEQLISLLIKISKKYRVRTYRFHKRNFLGTVTGVRFRNYMLRKSLESFFDEYVYSNSKFSWENIPNFEIIIDRYLDGPSKDEQEVNLKEYLNGNYNLPRIDHITMVDSRYTPMIQILDIVSDYLRKIKFIQENNETKIKIKEFWK